MKKRFKITLSVCAVIATGFLLPEPRYIPVSGATSSDWNKDSFWYEPWGSSVVHKGVDIFARKGTPALASSHLLIVFKGEVRRGGKIVLGLGPKWRLHYFAHLDSIESELGMVAAAGDIVGSVGDSGNAKGKQPHLHFSILSLVPIPWLIDGSTQGMRKAVYLNPIKYFQEAS